jgi:predicted metal-dependent phosphotriesterase family hydrolase
MFEAQFPRIQTVTGAMPVSAFDGPVLPHEHLRTDTRWGVGVESDPCRWLDEETHATAELKKLGLDHALNLVVDHSCLGMARDPAALARIAVGSRISVVASTGYAAEPFSAELIRRYGVDELTAELLKDIGAGLEGTSSRPGLIVAATWGEAPTQAEERAVLAVARASLRTDLPVATEGLGTMEILLTSGVPAKRVSTRAADPLVQRKIAEWGSYVSVTDPEHVLALLEAGHADRVLLSSGVSRQSHIEAYGGHGYARLFRDVLPALSEAGVDEGTIRLITERNPIRWLAGLDH